MKLRLRVVFANLAVFFLYPHNILLYFQNMSLSPYIPTYSVIFSDYEGGDGGDDNDDDDDGGGRISHLPTHPSHPPRKKYTRKGFPSL